MGSKNKIMKWERLKNNKCPKCNALMYHKNHAHVCSSEDCDFVCSTQKLEEIVNSLYRKKEYTPRDNQEALNNL